MASSKIDHPRGRGTSILVVIAVAVISSAATTLALRAVQGGDSAGGKSGSSAVPSDPVTLSPRSLMDTVSLTLPSAVSIVAKGGSGSGVIVSADGWILTNRHVVGCEKRVNVTFEDGRETEGVVKAIDSLTDLALIRTPTKGLKPATLGEAGALEVGQPVAAIGNSEGYLANTVTSGVISALWRQVYLDDDGEYRNLIQTDAPTYGGNSGGPLINLAGEVVGINTATAVTEERVRAQGLSFAIPSDLAAPIVKEAVAGTDLSRPWLGVRHVPVDAGLIDREQLSATEGALLWPRVGSDGKTRPAVSANSPAAAAGLRQGDVITAVDGMPVDDHHPLDNVLVAFEVGADVTLTVTRGSQELALPVHLGKREGRPVGC